MGLGFALKRALQLVGSPATVVVAELMPPLIEWNRTFLVEHNGPLLEDPRTKISQGDLFDIINAKSRGSYDALLLDIDNTPDDLITAGNARLYSPDFPAKIREILTPNGCVAYWLSEPAPKSRKCLIKAGFDVAEHAAKPHEKSKRARHCIYRAARSQITFRARKQSASLVKVLNRRSNQDHLEALMYAGIVVVSFSQAHRPAAGVV